MTPSPGSTDPTSWLPIDVSDSEPLTSVKSTSGRVKWAWLVGLPTLLTALAACIMAIRPNGTPASIRVTVQIPAVVDLKEKQEMNLQVGVRTGDVPLSKLSFSLVNPPRGATIGPRTGLITWTPDEPQGPGTYPLVVRVGVDGQADPVATAEAVVNVAEVESPLRIAAIPDQETDGHDVVRIKVQTEYDDLPATAIVYRLDPGAPEGTRIDPSTGALEWDPKDREEGAYKVVIYATRASAKASTAQRAFKIRLTRQCALKL